MRVGGRLSRHPSPTFDHLQIHPILLPKGQEFTKGVIVYYHEFNLQAGPQLTLSSKRPKFWFINGRSVVHHRLRSSVKCFGFNLNSSPPLGDDLLTERSSQSRPFECTEIDLAVPLRTKCAHKRFVTKFMSYVCFFGCTATKAILLELVCDFSTAARHQLVIARRLD